MEHLKLVAKKRELGTKGKLADMRRAGNVPGVVYGPKTDASMLEVKASDLRVLVTKRNHVVELDLDGQVMNVMVKQVDRDPIRRDIRHIDFLRVDEVHPVIVSVPVISVGVPIGVKLQGGVFAVAKKSVKLRSKVQDIPENFTIDVSEFESGKTFYVEDLKFDKGVFVTPPRTALFGVGTGRKEEDLSAKPAAAAAPAAAGDKDKAAGDKDKAAAPAAKGGKK